VSYPPQPWDLRGQMYVSVWLVPRAQVPPLPGALAAEVRPLTVAGRALVGTAWVDYGPGGVLEYRELLCAVLVRRAFRPLVSIVDIWVDSPTSRDGGRELWGIPKELAEFDFGAPQEPRAAGIARARMSVGRRLPGRWPTRFSVVQAFGEGTRTTPVRARAAVRHATAAWQVVPDGGLAYLAGRQPLLTLALRNFRMVFGRPPGTPRDQAGAGQ
jgi:hypothetical protein